MFKKLKKKIKVFFSPLFNSKKCEGGWVQLILVILGLLGTGYLLTANWQTLAEEFLVGAGSILMTISRALFGISKSLFDTTTSSSLLQKSILGDPAVMHGWRIVRDFANMFVVLGFVVVGIATILRLREYEAQKLLPKLIIVALLINFSALICGIFIDATNVAMNYFLIGPNAGGGAGITTPIENAVYDPLMQSELDALYSGNKYEEYLSLAFSTGIYSGIAAMIFFIYSILLVMRHVALMCLVILSPLAFVAYAFPLAKSIYDKWLNQFFQWAIIGVPTGFFIYLAGHIAQGYGLGTGAARFDMLIYWIPVAFMLFAYSLIFQTSAIGASAGIGLATGAVGYALGASKWAGGKVLGGAKAAGGAGAKVAGRKLGLDTAGQSARDTMTKWGEKMGMVPVGTGSQRAQNSFNDAKKRTAAIEEQRQIDLAKGKASGVTGRENKAAVVENLVANKQLHKVAEGKTAEERKKSVANAVNFAEGEAKRRGYHSTVRKDAEKLMPGLAALDAPKVAKKMADTGASEQGAKFGVVEDAIRGTDRGEFIKTSAESVKDPVVAGATPVEYLRTVGEKGKKDMIDQYKKYKGAYDSSGKLLGNSQQTKEHLALRLERARLKKSGDMSAVGKIDDVFNELESNPNFA